MEWILRDFEVHNADSTRRRHFSTVYEFFADWCRSFRSTYSLTQAKLAEHLGSSSVIVSLWEDPAKHSLPNPMNQFLLKKLERELWMQRNWSDGLKEFDTPAIKAIKSLLWNREDEAAQTAAEYLLKILAPHLTQEERIHLFHVAALTYAVASDQQSERGRQLSGEAYAQAMKLPESGKSAQLCCAIRNEILGYECRALRQTAIEKRASYAQRIIEDLLSLFKVYAKNKRHEPILLWNALECACEHHPIRKAIVPILQLLYKHDGEQQVFKCVERNSLYKAARLFLKSSGN